MARPLKVIDAKVVQRLAGIHCTTEEIAAVVGCSPDTLERRFAGIIKTSREKGRASLRRQQIKAAEAGNTVMLIWLGKQLLGQREPRQELEHSGPNGGPIPLQAVPYDLSSLSRDELIQLRALMERAIVTPPA